MKRWEYLVEEFVGTRVGLQKHLNNAGLNSWELVDVRSYTTEPRFDAVGNLRVESQTIDRLIFKRLT